jgi:hypothetical protein
MEKRLPAAPSGGWTSFTRPMCRPVVLGASPMGYGVYRRLGFIDAGEMAIVS